MALKLIVGQSEYRQVCKMMKVVTGDLLLSRIPKLMKVRVKLFACEIKTKHDNSLIFLALVTATHFSDC